MGLLKHFITDFHGFSEEKLKIRDPEDLTLHLDLVHLTTFDCAQIFRGSQVAVGESTGAMKQPDFMFSVCLCFNFFKWDIVRTC